MFKTIKLNNNFSPYKDHEGNDLKEVLGLSKINILVGANNSGKSRFMRELAKIKDDIQFTSSDKKVITFLEVCNYILKLYSPIFDRHKSKIATGTIASKQVNKDTEILKLFPHHFSIKFVDELSALKNFVLGLGSLSVQSYFGHGVDISINTEWTSYISSSLELTKQIQRIEKFNPTAYRLTNNKFYLPILRSLNSLHEFIEQKEQDIFDLRIKKVYSITKESGLEVFSGQTLFKTVRTMLLGDKEDREKIKKFELFLSSNFFDNKEVTLIPKEKPGNDVLHISIGGNEKPIYDVGDGIQSIIILTFPFFIVDSGVFFLEEPESNLHPGMQRKVIEVMESFPQHQYFITTHSNHFLDLTLDYNNISIYKFEGSEDKFTIEQVNGGNIATLKLLGVKNSSVFLSNCTIWIEGITDRLYIKKYLELYIASHPKAIGLVEDIDYSFVEYGGGNITHWSFLDDYSNYETIEVENLCGKLFLVIDNDDEGKAPKRKTALIDKLGDRFYELQCREIENSLPFDVIKSVVNHYEGEKAEFKELRSGSYPHKDEKIGEFIESRLLKSFKRKGGYKSESGTIVSKVQFCEKAQEFLNSYDALTPAAKDLIEKIYNFILSNK